jgi:hypothetical protein
MSGHNNPCLIIGCLIHSDTDTLTFAINLGLLHWIFFSLLLFLQEDVAYKQKQKEEQAAMKAAAAKIKGK